MFLKEKLAWFRKLVFLPAVVLNGQIPWGYQW